MILKCERDVDNEKEMDRYYRNDDEYDEFLTQAAVNAMATAQAVGVIVPYSVVITTYY